MNTSKTNNTRKLVLAAILTALVIVLQLMGSFIKFGPFSISLVLVPIIIGAATCGVKIGAWLGFIFGTVVLAMGYAGGDAAAFLAINHFGTYVTVLLKGILCGYVAGLIYKLFERKNKYVAVICSAIACPIVNTGIFILGCFVFFLPTISNWADANGFGTNVVKYIAFAMVGGNFIFEFITNIFLSPIIVRLLNIRKKSL